MMQLNYLFVQRLESAEPERTTVEPKQKLNDDPEQDAGVSPEPGESSLFPYYTNAVL